jgi:1-acyl-sn-glycerol-3-phosphate acyltransferase
MTLRTIWTALAAVFFFLCGLPIMLVVLIAGVFSPAAADRISYAAVCWGLRMVGRATGCPVTIIGKEHLQTERAAMYAGNHRSIFDIILTAPILPRPFVIVAKQELGKIPLLHFWMTRIHCLFLNRSDIKSGAQMVADAANAMKSGNSILIFPEGTRTKEEGRLGEFKGGSFKIAIRSGAPVVPVTIIGTGNIFEDHMMKIFRTPVTIVFGEPIETKGMSIADRKLLPEKVADIIARTYQEYAPDKWRG